MSSVHLIESHAGGIHAPLHEVYSEAYKQGNRKELISLLAEVVPGLEDIAVLTEEDRPVVHLGFAGGSVPIALAGDGVRSLAQLAFELAMLRGGLALIEEPELHQHPASLRRTARVLVAAARRGVQIVLSTHSLELIDDLIAESGEEDLQHLSIQRLALEDGQLKVSAFSGEEAARARTEIEEDLR